MERRFIRERRCEGIQRARPTVCIGGRPRIDRAKVKAMNAEGHGPAAIARAVILGCRPTESYKKAVSQMGIILMSAAALPSFSADGQATSLGS